MLEKYVASLLVPYLSKFIENIDATQLQVDIWSGKASLKDLILRPDAIEALLAPPDTASEEEAAAASGASSSATLGDTEKPRLLPIRLTRGVCKNAQLYIPLKRLRSEPVVLEIDEVLVTVQSLEDAQRLASSLTSSSSATGEAEVGKDVGGQHKGTRWDAIAARKQRELDAFEAERRRQREAAAAAATEDDSAGASSSSKDAASKASSGGGGYFSRLTELVVNNIIVKIRSVHIRYEDKSHRTVLGAILGDVQLLTINESTGEAMFTDPSSLQKTCKRFVMSGLQAYCDAPCEVDANEKQGRCWLTAMQSDDDWQNWYHLMRKRVRDGDLAQSTIFGPISGTVDVKVVFKSFMRELLDTPYATVQARMDHVLARLSREQYTTIARAVSRFVNPDKTQRAVREVQRPRVPVKGHAREWWRYAQQSVLHSVREPRRACLLAHISEVCRMDYQVLYRDVVRQTEMSAEKKRTYRFITRFMTVEDMIAGRRDVYSQLALEMQRKRKDNQAKKTEPTAAATAAGAVAGGGAAGSAAVITPSAAAGPQAAPQKKGWFSWLRGSSATTPTAAAAPKTPEEEEEEFFKNLERDYGITAEEAARSDNPREATAEETAQLVASAARAGLPPGRDAAVPANYVWLDVAIDLPYAKYAIDMGKGESTALQLFHFHTRVQKLNHASSALFHLCVQNVSLSNSAAPEQSEGAALVRQLVEGVRVGRGVSSSSPRVTSLVKPDGTVSSNPLGNDVPATTLSAATVRSIVGLDGANSQASSLSSAPMTSPREDTAGVEVRPLLDIAFAYQPVEQPLEDTKLDVALRVQLLPLRIVMDPNTIESVAGFFELPSGVDVSSLTTSTIEAASAVGTMASQELKSAMTKVKGVYVAVDVSAPILVLPTTLRGRRTEAALAMALGRVQLTSKPLSETEKQRRLERGGEEEDTLYYTSRARFGKFYVELTTLEDALRRPEKGFMLVPEVSIVADILQRIDDNQTNRDRFVVRLKVPALRVGLSLHQVYRLTHLVETWLRYSASSRGLRDAAGERDLAGLSPATAAAAGLRLRSRSESLENSLSLGESSRMAHSLRASRLGGASQAPPAPRGPSPLFAASEEPSTTEANKRASAALGRSSGTMNGASAASAGLASPHSTTLPAQDTPLFRIELLVQSLGVDIFEDDAHTLAPITPSRFAINCANAELIFAKRTTRAKLLLILQETTVLDNLAETSQSILHSTGLRVDVGLSADGPVAVGLLLDKTGLTLRVGTPCMELLEGAMDMVNLVMSTMDSIAAVGGTATGPPPTLVRMQSDVSAGTDDPRHTPMRNAAADAPMTGWDDAADTAHRERQGAQANPHTNTAAAGRLRSPLPAGNLASSGYALGSNVSNSSAAVAGGAGGGGTSNAPSRGDTRVANVSIRINGESRLELMGRHRGDTQDYLFATATVSDVDVFLKKNRTTMEVSGKVGSVEAVMSEKSGLLAPHRRIVRHDKHNNAHMRSASHAEGSPTGTTSPFQPATPTRRDTERPSAADISQETLATPSSACGGGGGGGSHCAPAPQISFTYRKNEPVVPVFGVVEGKRVLRNAAELRYSSALELEVGASTLCLDLHTVMVLKAYFTTGFFSRISRLGDRPLYNCRTLPPAQEPLQLLMSIRIVVTDAVVELPLDARGNASEYFGASIGHVTVQNNLLSAEGQQSMAVSLREICLWRYGEACTRHGLLPSPTFIEIALRTDLDEDSEEPSRIDIRSDEMNATVNSADLVDMATLLRQNLSLTAVDEADSAPAEEPTVRQFVGSPNTQEVSLTTTTTTTTAAVDADSPAAHPGAAAGASARETGDGTPQGGLHISVVPPSGDVVSLGNTSASARTDTMIGLRVAKLAVVLEDAPSQPLFRFGATSVAMVASTPANQLNLLWKSLDVVDVRPLDAPATHRGASSACGLADASSDSLSRLSGGYSANNNSIGSNPATTLMLCGEGHVQFGNSLTTRNILMSDFGVRPSALTSVDTDAMESITSSEVMTTLGGGYTRKGSRPPQSAMDGVGGGSPVTTPAGQGPRGPGRSHPATAPPHGDDKDEGDRENDNDLGGGATTAEHDRNVFAPSSSPTELMTVSVLSIKFSLKRFAISDQWLSLYDLVCNEEVMNALTAPQPAALVSVVSPSTNSLPSMQADAYHPSSSGFRCTVSTSSVSILFLTTDRHVLCDARLESLLVDVAALGIGSHVSVKVQTFELIDTKSGERILRKRPVMAKGATTTTVMSSKGGDNLFSGSVFDGADMESPLLPGEYGSGYAMASFGTGSPLSLQGTANPVSFTSSSVQPPAGGGGGGGVTSQLGTGGGNTGASSSAGPSGGEAGSAGPAATGGGPMVPAVSLQGSHGSAAAHHNAPPPPMTRFTATLGGHGSPLDASAAPNTSNAAHATPTTNNNNTNNANNSSSANNLNAMTSGGGDVLHFSFKGDDQNHKNRIQLQIGQLDALLSMPLIYGLIEYFTSPDQPIAKISSLGVMKEQRERVAAAAQAMANTSVIGLHVLWQQPRILCVMNGMDLANWSTTGRSRAVQVRLGVMKTSVIINQALQQLSVTLRAQDFSIDDVLEKASLRLSFITSGADTQQVRVELDKTVALFHPAEFEHVIRVMHQNLLLPPTRRYYDVLPVPLAVSNAAPDNASSASLTETAAAATTTTVSRTVTVSIRGLHLAMHDLMRMRTHTLTLANLAMTMNPDGDMELVVPIIFLQEHFTNRYLLYSGCSSSATTTQPASPLPSQKDKDEANALTVTVHKDPLTGATMTDVAVSNTVVTLVPRGVGSLINVLLSISLPAESGAATTEEPVSAPVDNPLTTDAASTPRKTMKASHKLASQLTARLDACGVRLPMDDCDLAMVHLQRVSCSKMDYTDGSSDLHVVLGQLIMEDLMPRQTLYKSIIEPFVDASASEADDPEQAPSAAPHGAVSRSSSSSAGAVTGMPTEEELKRFVDFTLHTVATVRESSEEVPLYGTHVTCRVGNLCFTCVPDVVHGIVNLATEVANSMSENNRGRAMGYVSETASAGLQAMRRNLDGSSAQADTTATTTSDSQQGPTAAAAAASFTKLDVLVQRPELRLVASSMSLDTVELFTGTLSIQTELLSSGSRGSTARLRDTRPGAAMEGDDNEDDDEPVRAVDAVMEDFAPRQAFRLSMHRMDALVLNEPVLKRGCRLDVQLLQGHNTSRGLPQSHLDVSLPLVAMQLSQNQLDLLLDVVGMFVGGGEGAGEHGAPDSHELPLLSDASPVTTAIMGGGAGGGVSPPLTVSTNAASLSPPNTNTTTATGASTASALGTSTGRARATVAPTTTSMAPLMPRQSSGSATTTRVPATAMAAATNANSAASAMAAASPPTSLFSMSVEMRRLEVDMGDAFRWTVRRTTVQSHSALAELEIAKNTTQPPADSISRSSNGSRFVVALEELNLQHAGSHVQAFANNPTRATADTARAALHDVRDIVVVRHLRIDSRTTNRPPTPYADSDSQRKSAALLVESETETTVNADVMAFAISPTSLFDARELLYLPFSSKVLHIPVDPIPVLPLTEAVTRLDRDVVLDDKHVLLTANRLRCCYELDLQRHHLVLTGAPSGQLVLYEGCEVTITNGTIVLPGLYTLGSFVSFAPQSALYTTSSCVVEKKVHAPGAGTQFQLLSPMPSAGNAGSGASGGAGSGSSPMYTRVSSPMPSASPTFSPVRAPSPSAPPAPLVHQHARSLVNLNVSLLSLSLLSEDVVDLSPSLESELILKMAMDVEDGSTTARSIGVQLRQIVSGELEPHVVLPTNLAVDISGTQKLVVSVLLDSLEFCARAALLASLVETLKDFGTAFLEEMTVTRVKPTVRMQDACDSLLHSVTVAGDCTLCGAVGTAYLGKEGETKGSVCYQCCTGVAAMPSMEVRVELPLIDAILLGAEGDMLHLDVRRLVVNVDPNMDVSVGLRASLFTLNNAAAVWEPCVEMLSVSMTGNVTTNDYKFMVERLDYVLSPINVTQLSVVMGELTTPALMQKQTRKAFRRMAAAKAPAQSYKGTRMYQAEVEEAVEDVRQGAAGSGGDGGGVNTDEEELLSSKVFDSNNSMVNNFSMTARVAQRRGLNVFDLAQGFHRGRGERLPPLLAPGKRSASAEAIKAAQAAVEALTSVDAHPFAYVFVTNHLHSPILFEDKRVDPRGGTARIMTSHASALVRPVEVVAGDASVQKEGGDDEGGYVVDLANPILYAQGPGFFVETVVAIQRSEKDVHRLKRIVQVRVFPLHTTRTIICVENKMSFPLDVRTSKAATAASVSETDSAQAYRRPMTIKTGERFFFDAHMALDDPLVVEPNMTSSLSAHSDKTTTDGAEELDVVLPQATFHTASAPLIPSTPLGGSPMQLNWTTDKHAGGSQNNKITVSATVSAQQEAIRGGVPVYVLTVEPRFHVVNKLPCAASLSLVGASATAVTMSGAGTQKVEVGARGRAGLTSLLLHHRLSTLNNARFAISVTQKMDSNTSRAEVFTTPSPFVAEGLVDAGDLRGDGSSSSGNGSERGGKTQFLTLLSADKTRQLVIRLIISGPRLVLTTPFLLVNHTPLPLHLVECDPSGQRKKRVNGGSGTSMNLVENTNYDVLPANMNCGLAASPAAPAKEEFFVRVQTGSFQAKCVPLHVQQRGVMLLEEVVAISSSADAAVSKTKTKSKSSKSAAAMGEDANKGSRMLHLAYMSRLDEAGAIRVVITPRWVVLNRCRFPLVVAPSSYAGVNSQDAAAAATAAVAVAHADSTTSSTISTPTSHQEQVDDFKQALLLAQTEDEYSELPANTTPLTVGAMSAVPLFETPFCPPEVGFHLHVLQDATAPLHSTPVDLETIHSEVILAYNHNRGNAEHGRGDRNDGGGALGRHRDRFVEVSLVAQDPYTYVVLQEPETTPFLLLNRTPYHIEVRDTAVRSAGRLVARAGPGMGTELLLDPSVTTTTTVLARQSVTDDPCLSSTFDLGRNMTTRERSAAQAAGKLQYAIHYGAYGHCDVDIRIGDSPTPLPKGESRGGTSVPTTTTSSAAGANMASGFSAAAGGTSATTTAGTASGAGAAAAAGLSSSSANTKRTTSQDVRVHVQEPPSALSVLMNMTALTLSVTLPSQDILFAAVLDTRVSWARDGEREKTTFSVRNFQVDNQTEVQPRYDACVLALRKSENATAVAGYVERVVVPAKRLLCFQEIKFDCAPIALRVSDLLLARVLRFSEALAGESELRAESLASSVAAEAANSGSSGAVRRADKRAVQSAREQEDVAALHNPTRADLFKRAPLQADFMTTRLMVERFIVNPLLIRFWLTRDVEEHDFFRENIHSREAALLSMMVASCEDVQIAAPGLACVKRVSRLGVFLQWVVKCYTDGLVAQLQGVVLQYASSLPLLGAPVKLFSGIGGGAVRLFKDPIEGLATSPSAFLAGLGSGSTGFVQGLAGGGLGAFSNLTDAGSRFLSLGSGTSERERQSQNTLSAFARGVQGIYQKPMEGRAEGGAAGFLKGAVQGLVGVVANPVSGMLSDVSKATGAISRLVSDTYVPKTQRMHAIRSFHANGGIAPWGAVVTVYQYERLDVRRQTWSGANLMSHVDGPEWYPCTRESATYEGAPIAEDRWHLDRHEATVNGWTFSSKYYSSYTARLTRTVRTRRKHWTALMRPLPYSGVAAFLRVNPGMATQPRTAGLSSRSASVDFSAGNAAATVVTFTPPGVLSACTVQEAKAAQVQAARRHKRRYHRTFKSGLRTTSRTRSNELFDNEEFEDKRGVRSKMRGWTSAGRNVGVKAGELRSKSSRMDDDEDLPLQRLVASDFQLPGAPPEEKRRHSRTPSRVTFAPGGTEPTAAESAPPPQATERTRSRSRSAGGRSGRSRPSSSSRPAEPISSSQQQNSRNAPITTTQHTPPPTLTAYAEQAPPARCDTQRPTPAKPVAVAVSPLRPAVKPERDVVVIYEYERKVALLGWGRRLMDSPAWQDGRGHETVSRDDQRPPAGWSWASEWVIVGGNSKDGWETPVNGDRNLRRRCWQRVVIQQPQ